MRLFFLLMLALAALHAEPFAPFDTTGVTIDARYYGFTGPGGALQITQQTFIGGPGVEIPNLFDLYQVDLSGNNVKVTFLNDGFFCGSGVGGG